MGKRFHACDLSQPFLLAPVVQDWLPENHLARFVGEVCEGLDLSHILAAYERRDGRGKAAYHPLMLTRLLLYGYAIGMRSSRQIERATRQDLAFRYLAANQHPDHDTIAAFRQEHLQELSALFSQVLQICREAKLVRMGLLAVDGTKIQANASRSQTRTYSDLQISEQKLRERMRQLLLEAEQVDQAESAEQIAVDLLPKEYSDAQQRLNRIEQAKAVLEERAKQEAADVQAEIDQVRRSGGKPNETLRKRYSRKRRPFPAPEAKANLSDPDSRLMMQSGGRGFLQAYNTQLAVDAETQVIVAALVCQNWKIAINSCPCSRPYSNRTCVQLKWLLMQVTGMGKPCKTRPWRASRFWCHRMQTGPLKKDL
jgi:transposase